MSQVILSSYEGHSISIQDDGWFNATQAASKYGKLPAEWLRLPSTVEYVEALKRHSSSMGKTHRSKTGPASSGGGTWLHPKLAVAFARWLNADFAVWCDVQIEKVMRGQLDHRKLRHEAASSYKVMQQILQLSRTEDGKDCKPHHFSNEARLVNFALTGEFKGVDRDAMTIAELTLLAKLEERNAVLIGRSLSYEKRKVLLEQFAVDHRAANAPAIEMAA